MINSTFPKKCLELGELQEKVKEQQDSFLKEICIATFYTDKKVSYVGVVDSNGKLLVGEFRELLLIFMSNPLYFIPVFWLPG